MTDEKPPEPVPNHDSWDTETTASEYIQWIDIRLKCETDPHQRATLLEERRKAAAMEEKKTYTQEEHHQRQLEKAYKVIREISTSTTLDSDAREIILYALGDMINHMEGKY